MSKEEQITQIADNIKLSTFTPEKEDTIFITFPPWEYTRNEQQIYLNAVSKVFPDNNVVLKFDGIMLESHIEDDLK